MPKQNCKYFPENVADCIWNSWRGPGPPHKLQNPKGINYLICFASIFALFSRSHSTFDFFLDNTDSLFALFLILVNPIYVWDVFNVTNVTTFLFDGEIDVPKIGKSSGTFYNQYITPERFLIFQTRENVYFEGQVSSKHKQIWAFLQSLEGLCLFVWSITTALIRCFYLGIIILPQKLK